MTTGAAASAVTAALMLTVAASGCGSSNASAGTAEQKAQQLVSAARAAGVAPNLTVSVAKSLYDDDAPTVCKVFQDGLTTAERNDVLGNPSGRRPKAITSDAVTYGRVVVQTYCPGALAHYDDAVNGVDALKSEHR